MAPTPPICVFARILHGVLLSILVFIVFQFALASALDGESWQGMQILLTAVIIVPIVALANLWVVPIAWRSKKKVFAAGLLLPAVVGLVEYLWFSAGYRQQRAVIDAVGTDSSVTVVCLAVLFAPLVTSILCAGAKRVRLPKGVRGE